MVVGRPHNLHMKLPDVLIDGAAQSPTIGFEPAPSGGDSVWWSEGEDWRCTIALPVRTPNSLLVPNVSGPTTSSAGGFSAWKARPHLLHYRGRHPQQCRSNAQGLNDIMSQLGALFPDSIIEAGPAAREKYVEELQHSRFCRVVRCDYSYRSRLYDSVAAGCVPVLINDGWHLTVALLQMQVCCDTQTLL